MNTEELALTPRSKEVILLARKLANKYSHVYLGTEHLLLALMQHEKGGVAQNALNACSLRSKKLLLESWKKVLILNYER